MRREWIQEWKPRETLDSLTEGAEKQAGQQKSRQDQCWEVESMVGPQTPIALAGDDGDLYAAKPPSTRDDRSLKGSSDTEKLFLENSVLGKECGSPQRGDYSDDDEEALLALNEVW